MAGYRNFEFLWRLGYDGDTTLQMSDYGNMHLWDLHFAVAISSIRYTLMLFGCRTFLEEW